ncbi:MAG: D-alanyl-D-alanine carboxypeptidase [SAR324 cluster bacterium]|nr:D-alanyl-D-alanine carboxypeptidase [SAR324 cluster bacterium]MBL7035022.1 D-alanyl-D-alanine carboxypeptidase [SAR324 cluster bacterium]
MLSANPASSAENINRYRSHYKAALLADADSGRILQHDRMHQKIYPASLVKMMVALITLEQIESGLISLQDSVKISRWTSKIGGHQVYLKQGEVFQLRELMKATVISSANDAAVAVAEHVYGSDKGFIQKMNERAKELGMKKTRFYSVHGLPPGRGQQLDVSSAYDLYLLAMELLKHPQYLRWSSIRLDSFRDGKFQLLNTNHRLIRNYRGFDGLKTGYHRRAGFNLVSSAKRDGQRFIAIILGAKNPRWRSKAVKHLLDYGFESYLKYELIQKGESVPFSVKIENGEVDAVLLQTNETLSILLNQEERARLKTIPQLPAQTAAPVKIAQLLGGLEYWLDGKLLGQVKLQTEFAVPEQSFFSGITGMLTDLSGTN